MTMLQVTSFILLWIVVGAEGVLLFLLYRQAARAYAPKHNGLTVGTPAPSLSARNAQGQGLALPDLLQTDYNLLLFGSLDCSGCRNLLLDHGVSRLLASRAMSGYFLDFAPGAAADATDSLGVSPSLPVMTIDQDSFVDYAVEEMPFAYILSRSGVVVARASVGEGLQRVTELCDLAHPQDHAPAPSLVPVSSVRRAGR